ncbi:MAG TPA: hypothetical protein VFW65_24355 [Pseudonocardiaceae bacterium]|nr:hypothetical protein [Pseudonocardiaceae bacterium]
MLVDYQNQDLSFVDGVEDVMICDLDTERVRATGEGDRIGGVRVIGEGVDGVLQLASGRCGEGEESGAGFGADEDAVAHSVTSRFGSVGDGDGRRADLADAAVDCSPAAGC